MALSEFAINAVKQTARKTADGIKRIVQHHSSASSVGEDVASFASKDKFIEKSPFWNRFLPKSMRKIKRVAYYPDSKVKKAEEVVQNNILLKRTKWDPAGKTSYIETFDPKTNKRVIREYSGGTYQEGGKEIAHEISYGGVVYDKKGFTELGETYIEKYNSAEDIRWNAVSASAEDLHVKSRKIMYKDGTIVKDEFNPKYSPYMHNVYMSSDESLVKRVKFNPNTNTRTETRYGSYRRVLEETVTKDGVVIRHQKYNGEAGDSIMEFDPVKQIRVTKSKYLGWDQLINERGYLKQVVTEDLKAGTKTTRRYYGEFLDDKFAERVVKDGKELRYSVHGRIGGREWREYERVFDPKTGNTTEKTFFKQDDLFPEGEIVSSKKVVNKDGVLISNTEYTKRGTILNDYSYDPVTKTKTTKDYIQKNKMKYTKEQNGRSETRYYDDYGTRINPDGSKYKYATPEEEAKEWVKSRARTSGSEGARTGGSSSRAENNRQRTTSNRSAGPRPSGSIGNKEQFLNDMDKFLNGSYKYLNDEEVNYLAKILDVENPDLLRHMTDKSNTEAKNLFRQLAIKYHPDNNKAASSSVIFRIIQSLHTL